MKVAAVTSLLFATIALANPAPVAQPNALHVSAEQSRSAIGGAILAPDLSSRSFSSESSQSALERRKKKSDKSKPKGSKGGNETNSTQEDTSSASGAVLPSVALELSALGVGIIELVRLWG